MKRRTTFRMLILFFFLFTGLIKADPIEIGDFENLIAPPTNDECANAISLTVNDNYLCSVKTPGTLVDATASTVASDSGSSCPDVTTKANDDVWFKFVATATSHRVELKNIGNTPTDLYQIIYDGGTTPNCSALSTPIKCSDSETNNLTGLTINNTYFIRVYSNSTASGATTTFDVCVGTMATVPANDDCANATIITSLPHIADYDATSATNNAGFINVTDCIDMNDGVWFEVTGAIDGGNMIITVEPTSWDLGIAVYTGTCGSLTCVESSNTGPLNVVEGVSFVSTLGTKYYINIAYPSGTVDQPEGSFNLIIDETLSIDKIVAKGFSYYPNPVDNVLTMTAKEPIQQISLYSVLGKEIKRVQQSELRAELNLYGLPAGTYFVKAIVGDASGTFKILKK